MHKLQKQIDSDLELPRGETRVLQAEDKDYNRGLLVKLLEDGGYDVVYWYDKLKAYPIEVLVDGESVKKDAKKVTFKFHPELKKTLDISKENGGEGNGGGGGAATSGSFGGGAGTVFTSTNSGIYSPTYGGGSQKKRKTRKKKSGIDKLADFITGNSPERKMIKNLTSFVVKALEKDEKKFQEGKKFRQQTSSTAMNDNVARVDYMKTWMGGYQADALERGGAKDQGNYVSDEIEEETEEREFK